MRDEPDKDLAHRDRQGTSSVIDVERILQALEVHGSPPTCLIRRELQTSTMPRGGRTHASDSGRSKRRSRHSKPRLRSCVSSFPRSRGLLHTEDYARATLTSTIHGRPARDVERAVHARLDRQEVLHDEARRFSFLMPEQAVRWRRAPLDVMTSQVRHMAEISTMDS